ncbi:hypothetical protein GYB59_10675 [bacterium]|nr:hypothetical protein [bacterium]
MISPGNRHPFVSAPLAACLVFVLSSLPAFCEETAIAPAKPELSREVDYARDIAPILKQNCLACHNAKTREGGLSVETPADMLKGGSSGEAILAGDPDASFLYLVASRQSEPVMPPLPNKMNAHKLTGEQVWLLKRWIELGAEGKAETAMPAIAWQPMPSHLQPIYSLELSPQEDFCVFGRGNGLEVVSLCPPYEPAVLVDPALGTAAHRDFVNAVAVHPSGDLIASAGYRTVHIWKRAAPEATRFASEETDVTKFACSATGEHVVTANAAGIIRVFTGTATPSASFEVANLCAFAISADGQRVAAAAGDQVTLFSVGEPQQQLSWKHAAAIENLVFAGNLLIATDQRGAILSWEIDKPQPESTAATWRETGEAIRQILLISPAGDRVATLQANGQVTVWDVAGRKQGQQWSAGADISLIQAAADGSLFVTVHTANKATVWDGNGKQLRQFPLSAAWTIQERALQDQLTVAKSVAADRKRRLDALQKDLDTRSKALEAANTAAAEATKKRDEAAKVRDAAAEAVEKAKSAEAAKPDDANLKKAREAAEAELTKKSQAFDAASEVLLRAEKTVQIEKAALAKAQAAVDSATAQHESANKTVEDITAAQNAHKQQSSKSPKVVGVHIENSARMQVLTENGLLSQWDLTTGTPLRTVAIANCPSLQQADFCGAAKAIAVAQESKLVSLNLSRPWTLLKRLGVNGDQLDVTDSPFADRVTALSFSPDGTQLATGGGIPSRSGELLVWDWQKGEIVHSHADAHSDVVLAVAFSPEGSQLLTGGADRFMRLVDAASGEVVVTFEGHTDHVLAVAWAADGLTAASGSADTSVKLWDRIDGSQKRTITTAGKQVTDLSFVGVGDHVASSSGDRQIRLFESGNGRHYRSFNSKTDYLYSLDVSRDETLMIGGGQQGQLRLWNAKTGQEIITLPPRSETSANQDAASRSN